MKKLITLLIAVTSMFATFAQTGKSKMSQGKTDTTVQVKYSCPMHTDVISDKAGKCPKCGMALVAKKVTNVVTKSYACPMHPDVVSDKRGTCSKCGMDLVEKKNPVKTKSKSKKSGNCCG